MKIIFAGSIGRFPVGGHAWCDMQYLLGFQSLGHEIFYLEECGRESWVYNWETEQLTPEIAYPTDYIRNCLEPIGLGDRWIYRVGEQSRGSSPDDFLDVCSQADLLIVRGVPLPVWRAEYFYPRQRIFLDVDPGFTQVKIVQGYQELAKTVECCDRLFTLAQRLGEPGCPIPDAGRKWLPTRHPVVLSHWPLAEEPNPSHFTTIMQWQGKGYPALKYENVSYGKKDREFPQFLALPQQTGQQFQLALTGGASEELSQHGWEIICGWQATWTPDDYRQLIQQSRAEFSVAKEGYIVTKSGWFSDRSICYLASGRPVLVQDTGIGEWLPTGEGILTFRNLTEAVEGVESINANYERQRKASRSLAQEYFDAERVLSQLLEEAIDS